MSFEHRQPSRRELLAALPLLAAMTLGSGCRGEAARRERAGKLAALVGGGEVDSELSAACRAALPEGDTLDELLAGIHRSLGRGARFAGDEKVVELATRRLAADLADGRWLTVEGWRLGDLEARLCALGGLVASEPAG